MSIRSELLDVRAEYDAMHTYDLILALKDMGAEHLEVLSMSRAQMIDRLMALEEHAAFH